MCRIPHLSVHFILQWNLDYMSQEYDTMHDVPHFTTNLEVSDGTVTNYRPVSLLCIFSIFFEIVIHTHMFFFLCKTLSLDQHGFMSSCSIRTNLACFMNTAAFIVSSQGQLDDVYFDLSNASNVVDHNLLLMKLPGLSVGGSLFKWM